MFKDQLLIPFKHPQYDTCECGITSKQFCLSFPDKPFSLCVKEAPPPRDQEDR